MCPQVCENFEKSDSGSPKFKRLFPRPSLWCGSEREQHDPLRRLRGLLPSADHEYRAASWWKSD